MGCEVNGSGEAKDADVGIAGGVGKGAIFRKGKVVGTPRATHAGQLTPGRSVPAGQRT